MRMLGDATPGAFAVGLLEQFVQRDQQDGQGELEQRQVGVHDEDVQAILVLRLPVRPYRDSSHKYKCQT